MYQSTTTSLKESLEEMLEASKYCVEYSKSSPQWDKYRTGGCLGYPAAILLFSIVDSMGSYFRHNTDIKIIINGKSSKISSSGWEHFKILNSKYFSQSLSTDFLKILYHYYRSSITRNGVLATGVMMYPSSQNSIFENASFVVFNFENGESSPIVFMKELYLLCRTAVDIFKPEINDIVPKSHQVQIMGLKKKL